MSIDMTGFAFPKADKLRVEVKREKRLTHEEKERECKKEVTRRLRPEVQRARLP